VASKIGDVVHEMKVRVSVSQEKTMSKVFAKAIGILALSAGLTTAAFAGQWTASAHTGFGVSQHIFAAAPASAPEIDPAGALSGLTLLLGGLAVVRGRRVKK
jgi:hypothetical protein